MAITPTPAHYEGFVYGAVDSHTYGVVISDTNAYDSAGRAVEMITIPGRNGAYAMDHKRYENIEITYHCSIPATDPADFISAISDLRNALGALTGYNRLTDDFNDNEYRMAVLKGGVGVTNINPQAGTFDVVFDCKPQRFLTSGETATAVTSGGSVSNPTLYDAKPLLSFTGEGEIVVNGYSITAYHTDLGDVPLFSAHSGDTFVPSTSTTITFDATLFNPGDTITMASEFSTFELQFVAAINPGYTLLHINDVYNPTGFVTSASGGAIGGNPINRFEIAPPLNTGFTFAYGTAREYSGSLTWDLDLEYNGGTMTGTGTLSASVAYDGDDTFTITNTFNLGTMQSGIIIPWGTRISGWSTKASHDVTKYIDFEIGEAYTYSGDTVVPVNNIVNIGTNLAVLSPGANEITYDNGIEDVTITPRWWKL